MKLFTRKQQPSVREEQNTVDLTSKATVQEFLDGFRLRDVDAAMSVVDHEARVNIYPLGVRDGGESELRSLLTGTVNAFPDLRLTVKELIEVGALVVAEIKVEGTQAADYLGAINQEKHLDVDQGWRFTVDDGRIAGVDAYWCQNQLYRRLAVKRLDQVAIV
jgi:predicted ester cyclase